MQPKFLSSKGFVVNTLSKFTLLVITVVVRPTSSSSNANPCLLYVKKEASLLMIDLEKVVLVPFHRISRWSKGVRQNFSNCNL